MKVALIGNNKCFSAQRLKEEFAKKGIQLDMYNLHSVVFENRNGKALFHDDLGVDLLAYDVYMFRGMSEFIKEFSIIAHYLKSCGKLIVEDVLTIGPSHVDKFIPTLIDNELSSIDSVLLFDERQSVLDEVEYPIIVKGLEGCKGKKVALAHSEKELLSCIDKFGYPVLLQKYIPIDCDYRAFVVDGEVLGAVVRYNTEDDFLTIRSGTKKVSIELPQEAKDVAIHATKVAGLLVAGVDLLEHEGKYYQIEVNMSPQFKVFERITEVNVAVKIVESIIRRYEASLAE